MMNRNDWNDLVRKTPQPHFLQTWDWGEIKNAYGWEPIYKYWQWASDNSACALLLKKNVSVPILPIRTSMIYSPKGPLVDWQAQDHRHEVISDIVSYGRKHHAIYVKIDPDVILKSTSLPTSNDITGALYENEVTRELKSRGWRISNDQIQFKNTVLLDIAQSEEEILSRMKQKTRYNIRLAERKGVTIRQATQDDFSMLYRLYAKTSLRDGFVIRNEAYYELVWSQFLEKDMARFLIAEVDNEPIAALFLVCFAGTAWYLYGMSQNEHRDKMPNHLLQWHAILEAKKSGCQIYDLWGAPEIFDETDPMWGVYRFKEGFGGKTIRTIGAWDYPIYPRLYALYTKIVPFLMDRLRKRGFKKTRLDINQND